MEKTEVSNVPSWIQLTSKFTELTNSLFCSCEHLKNTKLHPSDVIGVLERLSLNVVEGFINAVNELNDSLTSHQPNCDDERNPPPAPAPAAAGDDGQAEKSRSSSLVLFPAKTSAECRSLHVEVQLDSSESDDKSSCDDDYATDRRRCCQRTKYKMTTYCQDCELSLCNKCFRQLHKTHRHASVEKVVTEFRDKLDEDYERMQLVFQSIRADMRVLDNRRSAVLANMKARDICYCASAPVGKEAY